MAFWLRILLDYETFRYLHAELFLFSQHQSFPQSRNSFKVGMKLEGLDPVHPSLFCVLTVAEVTGSFFISEQSCMWLFGVKFRSSMSNRLLNVCLSLSVTLLPQVQGYRVRLHFDGYPECYDFWVNADSWDVKPPGWCEKSGLKLLLPKGGQTHIH